MCAPDTTLCTLNTKGCLFEVLRIDLSLDLRGCCLMLCAWAVQACVMVNRYCLFIIVKIEEKSVAGNVRRGGTSTSLVVPCNCVVHTILPWKGYLRRR